MNMFIHPSDSTPIFQGDILDSCPLFFGELVQSTMGAELKAGQAMCRVMVLTQSCDLANTKSTRLQVALVHEVQAIVAAGLLKGSTIRDQVRLHKVFGWYFLEESEMMAESIVDFRDLHTIPRIVADNLVREGKRTCSLASPYREHMAKHFADTYS